MARAALHSRNLRAVTADDSTVRLKLLSDRRREANAVFTFLTTPGVEATNWQAEQAIRPAVVNRKIWGGNRTERGAWTWARLVTVITTGHKQGLDVISALIETARAPTPRLAYAIP